jgi:hypothetical protein
MPQGASSDPVDFVSSGRPNEADGFLRVSRCGLGAQLFKLAALATTRWYLSISILLENKRL